MKKSQNIRAEDIKGIVQEKYTDVLKTEQNFSSCCGDDSCCSTTDFTAFNDDYKSLDGYNSDADYNLGCGIPTEYASIKEGDSVLDLGSGAGNDCFVARSLVGSTGKVTGIDFTDAMIQKANENIGKTGFTNIDFIKGDTEDMPLPDDSFDVVISNCVLNLVPDKKQAFEEIYRVLKAGAHFCISDVVLNGELPESLKSDAELYAGCVSGALQKEDYLQIVKEAGFTNIIVKAEKQVHMTESLLQDHLTKEQIIDVNETRAGIISITLKASKG